MINYKLEEKRRNAFAENLTYFRQKSGLTQAQLATKLDTSQNAIFKYEAGLREPKLTSMVRLANCLGISVSRLIMSKEEEEKIILKKRKRYDLLVTAGSRAAYMDCAGKIELPSGIEGEDILARFVKNRVDKYIKENIDISFDEYIETALLEKFGK